MQGTDSKRRPALLARGFAVICAAPIVAAGGAWAAPTERVLYSFTGGNDGANPSAGLIADGTGHLYGTTSGGGSFGQGVVFKVSRSGTETVLHSFFGQPDDGAYPSAGLTARNGNLYGTTSGGGASNNGVIFQIASGIYTVLHSFNGSDGANPSAGLITDRTGHLYGTTFGGGAGQGVVFKVSQSGTETVLYSFPVYAGPGYAGDGFYPSAGLIARNGNLYGTTSYGGTFDFYGGTVFELMQPGCNAAQPNLWCETVLYSFTGYTGGSDGASPGGGLIADVSGNLYGTTTNGGGICSGFACGTVFELTQPGCNPVQPNSWCERVLHTFTVSDGFEPRAGLIADGHGNLYGTTSIGGASGSGTVFKLSPYGKYTVLYSFCSKTNCSDGANPFAGLIADSDGNLYGTTGYGGASGSGTVFELTGTGFVER